VRFTTRRAKDAIASSGETPLIKRFVSVVGVPLSNSGCTTCYSSLDENADIGILIEGE